MSSLDVLDYTLGLEAALARRGPDGQPLLAKPLRRQAMREARRLVDTLAFRYAILDDRPLPEDLDYLRALESVKDPERAAAVFARRAPHYARTRRRRLTTTWTFLGAFLLLVAGVVYLATLETSHELAEVNESNAVGEFAERSFVVDANVTRLYVEGTIVVARGESGTIGVYIDDPNGIERFSAIYTSTSGNYLRENIATPEPGTWTLRVVYDAAGSARVTVNGVTPNR